MISPLELFFLWSLFALYMFVFVRPLMLSNGRKINDVNRIQLSVHAFSVLPILSVLLLNNIGVEWINNMFEYIQPVFQYVVLIFFSFFLFSGRDVLNALNPNVPLDKTLRITMIFVLIIWLRVYYLALVQFGLL